MFALSQVLKRCNMSCDIFEQAGVQMKVMWSLNYESHYTQQTETLGEEMEDFVVKTFPPLEAG